MASLKFESQISCLAAPARFLTDALGTRSNVIAVIISGCTLIHTSKSLYVAWAKVVCGYATCDCIRLKQSISDTQKKKMHKHNHYQDSKINNPNQITPNFNVEYNYTNAV